MQVFKTRKQKVVAKFDDGNPMVFKFSALNALRERKKYLKAGPRTHNIIELLDFLGNMNLNELELSPDLPIETKGVYDFRSESNSLSSHVFSWRRGNGKKKTSSFGYNEIAEHISGKKVINLSVNNRVEHAILQTIKRNESFFKAKSEIWDFMRPFRGIQKDITPEYLQEHIRNLWFKAFAYKATDEEITEWYEHKDRDGYVAWFWDKLCIEPRAPRF